MKDKHFLKVIFIVISFVIILALVFVPTTEAQTYVTVAADHDLEVESDYEYFSMEYRATAYFEIKFDIKAVKGTGTEDVEIILQADEDEGDYEVEDDDTFIYYLGDDAYSSSMTSYDEIGPDDDGDIEMPSFNHLFVMATYEAALTSKTSDDDWIDYEWAGSTIEKITVTLVASSTSATDILKIKEYKFESSPGGNDHGDSQDFGDYDSLSDADWDTIGGAPIIDTSDDTLYLRSSYLAQHRVTDVYDYEPVCGVDGLTYFNDAEAERLGVSVDYSGVCNIPQPLGLADSAWPCWGHDLRHTSRSPYLGAQTNELKWSYKISKDLSGIHSSPVIGSDGTIYIGDGCKVCALSLNGELKWSYNLGWNDGVFNSSPVIGADGTVYTVTYSRIYALNSNGSLRKIYQPESDYYDTYVSLIIGSDGTFYIQGFNGIHAIDPNDRLKWSYPVYESYYYPYSGYGGYGYGYYYPYSGYGYGGAYYSPAIGTDGTVYASGISYENAVYAIDPNGNLKWSHHSEGGYPYYDYSGSGGTFSSPAISADGTIYVGSDDHKVYALDPNGSLKWSYQTGAGVYSTPAIGADGMIYVGSDDHKVYALDPNGALKWSYQTGGGVYSTPAIGADGMIYVGSDDHKVYALDPNGALKWSYQTEDSVDSSPAIGADGMVYIINDNGKLYAFKSSETKQESRRSSYMSTGIGWLGGVYWPGNIIWPEGINTGWSINAVLPGNIGIDWPGSVLPVYLRPDIIGANWQGISANWQGNMGTFWPGSNGWSSVTGLNWPGSINPNWLQVIGSPTWPIDASIGWTGDLGSTWLVGIGDSWSGIISYPYTNFPSEVSWSYLAYGKTGKMY